jgi:cell division protein ZapA (FtsZ GTPase activity inhibitor)
MQDVELRIGNTTLKLGCDDPKELLNLTDILNKKVTALKKESNVSDVKAIFIVSIYLIDEIESLKQGVQDLKNNFYDQFEEEKRKLNKNYNEITDKIEKITEQLNMHSIKL